MTTHTLTAATILMLKLATAAPTAGATSCHLRCYIGDHNSLTAATILLLKLATAGATLVLH